MRFPSLALVLAVVVLAASCGTAASTGAAAAVDATSLSRLGVGAEITCAIVDDGGVACWGNRGYVGAGFRPGDAVLGISAPVAVSLPEGVRFVQVTASRRYYSYMHACALTEAGAAWCWGENQVGQLGDGGQGYTDPVAVTMPEATTFSQISAGASHTCALADQGGVWCWGDGAAGQLGDGTTTPDQYGNDQGAFEPTRVLLPDGVAVSKVAAGGDDTCVLTSDGTVWCWGTDGTYASEDPKSGPVAMEMPQGVSFGDLAASEDQVCALTIEGSAWCWVSEDGYGAPVFGVTAPTAVTDTAGLRFTRLTAGRAHFCALAEDGEVWCWGSWGGYGTAGSYFSEVRFPEDLAATPVDLSAPSGRRFTDIGAGAGQTCGIATDASVWCWGNNSFGQLGDGTTESSLLPVAVPIDLAAPAPVPVPAERLVLEPMDLEPYAGDAFLSPPPIWSLGVEQSRRIFGVFVAGDWQTPEYWGIPESCDECMYPYFARLGVSRDALSLFHDFSLSVSAVAGEGPVWVAETYDWTTFDTNYDGATPNLIFTPDGIIDVSGSIDGRLDLGLPPVFPEAFASDVDERIGEVAEKVGWGPASDIYLGVYSENYEVPLAPPRRTASGWSIPFRVQSGGGIHCCSYPFWARFELDLDARGEATGLRFLEWCYVDRVTFGSGGLPEAWPKVVQDLGASLSACPTT